MVINLNVVRQLKQIWLILYYSKDDSRILVYIWLGRFSVVHLEDFPPVRYDMFLYNFSMAFCF